MAPREVYFRMAGDFGDFRLHDALVRPERGLIERDGDAHRVKPKAMSVLVHLAGRPGEVVTRAELFDAIWPGQAVTDDVLTTSLVELRKALGDDARDGRFIETVPRRGLRLAAPVAPPGRAPSVRTWSLFAGAAATVLIAVASIALLGRDDPPSAADAMPVRGASLAVLPFVNMAPDESGEHFADGLSEELINRLSQLDGLAVTARTSSFHYKNRNVDLRDVGRELSVGHVLEGSVRRSEDALRVTAQLIDVGSGYHLWSDTYESDLSDIFVIQDDIAESVATALSVRLGVGDLGTFEGGTRNVAAFEAFMIASTALHDLDADGHRVAIEHYQRAVALDPDFALAWANLSNAYRTAWLTLGSDHAEHWSQLADEAIDRASALTPNAEAVLWTKAYIEVDRGNWTAARGLFDRLAERAPNVSMRSPYLDLLIKTGHASDGLKIQDRMRALDPFNADKSMYFAHMFLMHGDIDAALAELERGYALEVNRTPISVEGLVAALASGDEALIGTWLERARQHEQPGAKGVHTAMLDLYRDRDASIAYLREGFDTRAIPDYYVTIWSAYFGATDLTLDALESSPDLWAVWMPMLADARRSARFRRLIEPTGLVDYWREVGWNDFCRPVAPDDFICE